jgi:hypothetical protein
LPAFRERLNGARLQRALRIIIRRQALQFIFKSRRLGTRLEMSRIGGRTSLLMPDAIRERRNALPQTRSERSRFRPILRQLIVENEDGSGQLSDLVDLQIERGFRGCDQQAQYQRGQRADQAVAIFTTSFESGCRWLSDNECRSTTPSRAPPKITAKTSSEINRSFMDISVLSASQAPEATTGLFASIDRRS